MHAGNRASPPGADIEDATADPEREATGRHPVLDCIPDGVLIVDLDGHPVTANRAAERLLGSVDEWSGDYGLFLPDKTTPCPAHDLPSTRAIRGETVQDLELFVRNARIPAGAWYRVSATPWVNAIGAPRGAIVVFREITEHKHADQETARLASALEQTADSVVITDASGRILYVNRGFEAMTGYARAEVIGRTPALLKSGRHDLTFYRGMWATILRGEVFRSTLVNRRKNGECYWAEQTITPLRDEAGAISSFVSVGKDVTELRRAQEQELELRLAGRVQRRLYPRAAPRAKGYDIAGAALPSALTCGDYFDFLPLPDHGLGMVVADVSGHGLGPALVMAETRALLRSSVPVAADMDAILERIDGALLEDLESGSFVTLLLARLDPGSHRLTWANAGHPHGYVLDRQGALKRRLESTRVPLGVRSPAPASRAEPVVLVPGDLVLLATDGVLEAQNDRGEFFELERTLDLVREHRSGSAREILDRLFGAITAFRAGGPQTDDLTAVVCKVCD